MGGSSGERHSNPLQYSCLENPMDRRPWQVAVHKVTESRTQLKRPSTHTCIHVTESLCWTPETNTTL